MPWDQIANAKYNSLANLNSAITFLQQKHDERINGEPEFSYVFDDIARYQKEKDRKTISLLEKQRISERDDNDKLALKRTNERLKRLGQAQIEKLEDVPDIIAELDPFLEETAQITSDYIKYGRYAKK